MQWIVSESAFRSEVEPSQGTIAFASGEKMKDLTIRLINDNVSAFTILGTCRWLRKIKNAKTLIETKTELVVVKSIRALARVTSLKGLCHVILGCFE